MIFTENEINYNRILRCAMDIGEHMLVSGTEAGKVEDAISRICCAYGAQRVDVLSITSSIITTIETPSGEYITQTRRIVSRTNDLMRIEALNRLSRDICSNLPDVEYIEEELKKIDAIKPMRWFVAMIAFLGVSASFTVFFGGGWQDAIAALIAGLVVFGFDRFGGRLKNNKIVFNLVTSIAAGAVCIGLVRLGLGQNLDYIMIGVIMLLIPGMAMTGAIEDLLIGDTITGLLRLCEAIIAACAIAAGFAVSTFVFGATDLINLADAGSQNIAVQLGMAFLSAGFFGLKLGMKRQTRLWTAAIGGLLGWGAYLLMMHLGCHDFIACFVAATVGALYSQIMARVLRAPATVFLVPAVIPLVPGRGLYYTLSSFMHGENELISNWGVTTVLEALAIALGMVVVLLCVTGFFVLLKKLKNRKKL